MAIPDAYFHMRSPYWAHRSSLAWEALVPSMVSKYFQKNPFFIFLLPKMAFLVKQVLEIWCNLGNNQFSHKLVPISWLVLIYREFSPYLANFTHLSEFNPVCWKSFKFELHLHANILMNFWKNHFKAENE